MATFTVSTKSNAAAVAKATVITVIYDNPEAERALATQALVVKAQGGWRKHGIPATTTIKLSEYAPGMRHAAAPVDPREAYKAMTPAEQKQFLADLAAMAKGE